MVSRVKTSNHHCHLKHFKLIFTEGWEPWSNLSDHHTLWAKVVLHYDYFPFHYDYFPPSVPIYRWQVPWQCWWWHNVMGWHAPTGWLTTEEMGPGLETETEEEEGPGQNTRPPQPEYSPAQTRITPQYSGTQAPKHALTGFWHLLLFICPCHL